jgi:drug/metabolite transporter (DMT)-like permease
MLAMLCFASMDAISKSLVVEYSVRPADVGALYPALRLRLVAGAQAGRARGLRSRKPALQVFRSLVAVVEGAMFVLAFRYLPLADTHAVAATSPLIVIALGVLFLGEKAGPARWLAVAAGFVGVLLIVRPGFRTLDWPLLLPLAGALLWAGYQLLTRLNARWDGRRTQPAVVGDHRLYLDQLRSARSTGHGRHLLAWGDDDRRRLHRCHCALRADQGARLRRGGRGANPTAIPAGPGLP